jgi:hypothetical protein
VFESVGDCSESIGRCAKANAYGDLAGWVAGWLGRRFAVSLANFIEDNAIKIDTSRKPFVK